VVAAGGGSRSCVLSRRDSGKLTSTVPARAFVIRFPNGDYEYDVTRRAIPTIGDTLHRRGQLWRVASIMEEQPTSVHVERVEGPERRAKPVTSAA
jgi:hypothetical protein